MTEWGLLRGEWIGHLGTRRSAIGLGQGIVLGALWWTGQHKVWPATDPVVFAALALPFLFAPLAWLQGLAHIPKARLAVWTLCVALLSAGLGAYAASRDTQRIDVDFLLPESPLYVFLAAAFFIAQTLIVSAIADRRSVAAYTTYFDTAWKHAVQAAAAVGFSAALWVLLLLGAQLFNVIGLAFLQTLIRKGWFALPVTALAVAVAVHVTDVRPALVRGIRTLALTLLSWLLPLLALIVAGFLASLLGTGLAPLWNTKFAAALLLGVTAALIILINAAHQDGAAEPSVSPSILRRVARFAALLPAPLVAIAAYALALRVGEYGWTVDRVIALACIVVAACYALGYALSVVRARTWARDLERCNIATAFVVVLVIVALFSPLADPARISVSSQMARLHAGKVASEEFDYKYLRFGAGRYGRAALEKLAGGEVQVADVQERARLALQLTKEREPLPPTKAAFAAHIAPLRPNQRIPQSFVDQDWQKSTDQTTPLALACMKGGDAACEAWLVDLDGDDVGEVVLFDGTAFAPPQFYRDDGGGTWSYAGSLPARLSCADMRTLLRFGDYALVVPAHKWREIDLDGLRIPVSEFRAFSPCPPDPPK